MQYKDAVAEIKRRYSFARFFPALTDGRRKNQSCPFHGEDKNPSMSINLERGLFYCFSCHAKGDIISFYAKRNNISNGEAIKQMAAELGIEIDRREQAAPTSAAEDFKDVPTADNSPLPATQPTDSAAASTPPTLELNDEDKAVYCEWTRENLAESPAAVEYLNSRGISLETAIAAGIGFDDTADPAKVPFGYGAPLHPAPRIITFFDNGGYFGRSIDSATEKQYQKVNCTGYNAGLHGGELLTRENGGEVFICEGIFDALSLRELGFKAVALNSTSNIEIVGKAAGKMKAAIDKAVENEEKPPVFPSLIISLDNDEAGKKATRELCLKLKESGIDYIAADLNGKGKDINERLTADRQGLAAAASAAIEKVRRPNSVSLYLDNEFDADIDFFRDEVATGYENLDAAIDGGLSCGLYGLAAPPSIGKSTFALQMADQMATAGREVIYYTLEETRHVYAAKCISRRTRQGRNDSYPAIANNDIKKGDRSFSTIAAIEKFKREVGNRLNIIEGNFGINAGEIRRQVTNYARRNNARPVVFVDYLQILDASPANVKRQQGTREIVELATRELKQLSRELGILVFVVISMNRNNYALEMDFTALKETGGIEYTCDGVFGLQLQILDTAKFEKAKTENKRRKLASIAKRMNPRKLKLVILKNRGKRATDDLLFNYEPMYDYFYPCSEFERDDGTAPEYGAADELTAAGTEKAAEKPKKKRASKEELEEEIPL